MTQSHTPTASRKSFRNELENLKDRLHALEQKISNGEVDMARAEERWREDIGRVERIGTGLLLSAHDIDQDYIFVDGKVHRKINRIEKTYYCLSGCVRVKRSVYRRSSEPVICPMEIRSGMLKKKYTPLAVQCCASLVQALPARKVTRNIDHLGVLPYSASTLARVTDALGEQLEEDREEFEDALMKRLEIPSSAHSVCVQIDRVSILFDESPDLADVMDIETFMEENPDLAHLIDDRKLHELKFRMAYCASISFHDQEGETITTHRYGRVPYGASIWILREQIRSDIDHIIKLRPDLQLVLISDGSHELQNILDEEFDHIDGSIRCVDFWHLAQKIGKALSSRYDNASKAADILERWKMELIYDEEGVQKIRNRIYSWGMRTSCDKIDAAITYIDNNIENMNYAEMYRSNLPIGSGIIEATCKSLIALRFKRNGQRWRPRSAQALLGLRAVCLGDLRDDAFDLLRLARTRAHNIDTAVPIATAA